MSCCATDSAGASAAASAGVVTSTVLTADTGCKPEVAGDSGAVEFSWNPVYCLSPSGSTVASNGNICGIHSARCQWVQVSGELQSADVSGCSCQWVQLSGE